MKVILHLIIGTCLRILVYFSKFRTMLTDLFLFPISAYSFSSLKENYVYSLFKSNSLPSKTFTTNHSFIVCHFIIYI